MEFLKRKSIILIMIVAMVVQVAGTALAATVEWTSGGPHIASVTPTGDYITREYQLISGIYHCPPYVNSVPIPTNITITCPGNTNFPTSYAQYLEKALKSEGFFTSFTYKNTEGDTLYIPSTVDEGIYDGIIICDGRAGSWWVKGTNNLEGAPATICTGSYTFAPTDEYVITYKRIG